jgi:P27 family predicted phage terminase small subunit
MRGKKPTPKHLKLVKNSSRAKRSELETAARPIGTAPEPPDFLCDDAKVEWRRVAPSLLALRLLTELDVGVLGAYCQAFATAKQAAQMLSAEGLTVLTHHKNIIPHPLLGIRNKAMADMVRYAAELGCSATSRARLPVADLPLPGDSSASDFFK